MSGNNWISVNDRLPNDFGRYLVQRELLEFGKTTFDEYRQLITICTYFPDKKVWYDVGESTVSRKVVAWQPLPELWKDTNIPKKGDYGIFDGERWVKVDHMFTPISKPPFNDKSHISEYQKDILRNIYNDLWDFAEEVDNDFAGVWTVDKVIVRLNDYISRIKEVSDSQGE